MRGVAVGLAALAVLAAGPAGQSPVVPVVGVSQGPGGGGSDGGGSGSDGSTSGEVVPNPKHDPDGTSGDGAGSVPEPRRPDPARSSDGGAPARTPEPPRPPGPNRSPERPPAVSGSAKAASGPARPVGDAAAMAGAQILQLDPETAAKLREFLNTRRPEDRRTLDFTTTRVTADGWTRLVTAEGEDPDAFTATVTELGGPGPFVTQTPLLLRDEQGRFGTATLFRVALTDGGTRMVDAAGLRFVDVDDFLENNRFPATWTMLYPAGIRPEGDPRKLLTVPARTVTAGQRLRDWADRLARPATVGDPAPLLAPADPPLVIGRYQPGRDIAAPR